MKMSDNRVMNIAVCIATYNRPIGLERLLNSLLAMNFYRNHELSWKIVIVDNNPALPNKELIDKYRELFPCEIIYEGEKNRGIASVRNHCIKLVGNSNFIAFVDDDEIVCKEWLDELVTIQKEYDADVVKGPVNPKFEVPPPKWITKGEFLNSPVYDNGERIATAATGNALIKSTWLMDIESPFDTRFDLTGGEDTFFFCQLVRKGGRIVWSSKSVAEEIVPPERSTLKYILKRSFRMGNTAAIIEYALDSSIKVRVIRLIKAIFHISKGLVGVIPFIIVFGYSGLIKSITKIYQGIGEISGVFGMRYMLYKNISTPL